MKTMKERMQEFHDNAGDRHKELDKRITKINRKKLKKAAVAVTLTAAVMVGSLFSGPDELTGGAAPEILSPEPIVMDVAAFDADVAPEEEPAPEEAKKQGVRDRIRAALLAMPYWLRVVILVPLWALGYVLLLGGSFLKAALAPFAGVILSAVIGVAVMAALFAVTAKSLFPDMPWRKIFSKGNIIALAVCGAALAAADVIVPHYYSGYPYVAAAVKLAGALVVVNVLLARLKKKAEEFA
jgi:hypothetical protein